MRFGTAPVASYLLTTNFPPAHEAQGIAGFISTPEIDERLEGAEVSRVDTTDVTVLANHSCNHGEFGHPRRSSLNLSTGTIP